MTSWCPAPQPITSNCDPISARHGDTMTPGHADQFHLNIIKKPLKTTKYPPQHPFWTPWSHFWAIMCKLEAYHSLLTPTFVLQHPSLISKPVFAFPSPSHPFSPPFAFSISTTRFHVFLPTLNYSQVLRRAHTCLQPLPTIFVTLCQFQILTAHFHSFSLIFSSHYLPSLISTTFTYF